MKAISLWQPWASAMALGLKRVETRHWSAGHRGLLAIHAAKRWTSAEAEFAREMGLPLPLPLGAVVAVGTLVSCIRSEAIYPTISHDEEQWGDYSDGRFGWVFRDIVGLREPIPYKGAQGFFELSDDVTEAVLGQAAQIDPSPVQFGLQL